MNKIIFTGFVLLIVFLVHATSVYAANPNLKYFGYFIYAPYGKPDGSENFLDDVHSLNNSNVGYLSLGVPNDLSLDIARRYLAKYREYHIKVIIPVGKIYANFTWYNYWKSKYQDVINEYSDTIYGFWSDDVFWQWWIDTPEKIEEFRAVTKQMRQDFPGKAIMASESWTLLGASSYTTRCLADSLAKRNYPPMVKARDIEFLTDYALDYSSNCGDLNAFDPNGAEYQTALTYFKQVGQGKKLWLPARGYINGAPNQTSIAQFTQHMNSLYNIANSDPNIVGIMVWRWPRAYDVPPAQQEANWRFLELFMLPKYSTYNASIRQQQITIGRAILANNSVPIPGDIDGNGHVDTADYNILKANFGRTGSGIPGDIDGNGRVGIIDYNILVGNFGK